MPNPLEPEIIPPGGRTQARRVHRTDEDIRRQPGRSTLTDESLNQLASVLDDFIAIPGTNIRFGLDAIVGLIPGVGDLITGVAAYLMIYAGWQRGLPRVTLARMVANVAVDTLVGSMPILGDIFDAAWKANRKNYLLLTRTQAQPTRKQTLQDWLFLFLMLILIAGLVSIPFLVLYMLYRMWHG